MEAGALNCRVNEVGEHVGALVRLRGWVYNRRESGKLQFIMLRDGSGTLQAVVSLADVGEEIFRRAFNSHPGVLGRVTGTVRADQRAPGGFELTVRDVEVLQIAEDYPIAPKEHGIAFLMDHRHLWLRSSRQHAMLRLRAEVIGPSATTSTSTASCWWTRPSSPRRPAREPPRCSRPTTSTRRPTSPRAASSTTRPRPWRSARSTASARPSARRSPRPAAT